MPASAEAFQQALAAAGVGAKTPATVLADGDAGPFVPWRLGRACAIWFCAVVHLTPAAARTIALHPGVARGWSMDSSGPLGALERSPRGNDVRLPYGEASDGRLVRASEVPAGLDCGCTCPACGVPLVARRGGLRIAHFAHATDRACAAAHETMLHRLAKQLIADGIALALPEVAAEYGGRRRLIRLYRTPPLPGTPAAARRRG